MKKLFIKYFILTVLSISTITNSQALEISTKNNLDKNHIDQLIQSNSQECQAFLSRSKIPWTEANVVNCFANFSSIEHQEKGLNHLVSILLSHKPTVSTHTLSKVLEVIVKNPYNAKYSKPIKRLLQSGSSSDNITLQQIYDGNDTACDSIDAILKANEKLYKNDITLQKTIDGTRRLEDLHHLVNTDIGYTLCSNAIKTLISYNPQLLNTRSRQGNTPLYYYLLDLKHPQWSFDRVKLLMTRKNINIADTYGYTALHILLRNNKSQWDAAVIKQAIKLGANLNLKNIEGVSVKDMILKRPDLVKALKNTIRIK